MEKKIDYKCGSIAVIGPPNAGKSTLVNTILGEKVAIVSPKPQTTRNSIRGIYTDSDKQIIFIDTPGIHLSSQTLNRHMVNAAWQALETADAILLLLDGEKYATKPKSLHSDLKAITPRLRHFTLPIIVGINKIDLLKNKQVMIPILEICQELFPNAQIVPISASNKDGVDTIMNIIPDFLPLAPPLYEDDILSTAPVRFLVSEIIREKLFLSLNQELPYNLTVEIEKWEEVEGKNLLNIGAIIYTARKNHKSIIIGHGGQNLKNIGRDARKEINYLLDRKIYLELWVKVKEQWIDDIYFIDSIGQSEL